MKICTMNFPEENIFLCVKFLLFFHVISYNFLYTPTKLHLLITSKKHNVNAQIPNNGKIVKKKCFLKYLNILIFILFIVANIIIGIQTVS